MYQNMADIDAILIIKINIASMEIKTYILKYMYYIYIEVYVSKWMYHLCIEANVLKWISN